jgi:PAT family beta-lactamase induction signal transducer AmpG
LFSSLIAIPRTVANASTGFLVEAFGYPTFFVLCTVLAMPGMALLVKVAPWGERPARLDANSLGRPDHDRR